MAFLLVLSVLVASGCVGGISIDGQLTVIKNDCYERMAIGEKLHPSQIYKTFDHNTVNQCQQQCTQEKETCRAYSFGIGPKGNGSCLLSKQTIRETADLKPIGTISDTDFDLYIKKLDCQIVLEPPKEHHEVTPHKAPEGDYHHQYGVQAQHHEVIPHKAPNGDGHHQAQHHEADNTNHQHLSVYGNAAAQSSYHSVSSPTNGYHYSNGDTQHVETLVAIAEGPFAVLHPHHGILVDGGLFGHANLKPHGYGGNEGLNPLDYGTSSDLKPQGYGDSRPLYSGSLAFQGDSSGYGGSDNARPQTYGDTRPPPLGVKPLNQGIPNHSTYGDSKPQGYNYPVPSETRPPSFGGLRPLAQEQRPQGYDYPRPPPSDYANSRPSVGYGNTRPSGQYSVDRRKYSSFESEYHNYYDHYDKPYPNHPNRYGSVIPHPNDYLFVRPSKKPSTELGSNKACFRRTMAGHRTVRSLVRRLLLCDTIEQCQQECGDEHRFTCEGFNYRLDPSGRGKGECELLDLPLTRIEVSREVVPDPDYDFYTRDRNAAQVGCRQVPFYDRPARPPVDGYRPLRPPRPPPVSPPIDNPRPPRPIDRWEGAGYRPQPPTDYGNRRGDSYHHSHDSHSHYHYNEHNVDRYDYRPGLHYLPAKKGYPIIIPIDDNKIPPIRYGENFRYNSKAPHFHIPPPEVPKVPEDWGQYGGSYGLEYQGYGHRQNHHYWFDDKQEGYPARKPFDYLPVPVQDNAILPAEPRRPDLSEECSLRSATGFRLHKGIVKKFFAVPDIHQCEVLCVKEKDFPCASYAFRYTLHSGPSDNCFLSTRNYKELDYYTDLQPDKDFDIYTMNNRPKCMPGFDVDREDSDCFWRVRSGQRLDHSVVRDSLMVKSIVDCQLECLKSRRFTCRAYSYRYGSPIIGGAIDNCQLTDWPFYELDPISQFVPERDFEVYERASFGHGCEPNHFAIRGRQPEKGDQLCYIGFGSAARILPQAAIKSLLVPTELDCKVECSKARHGSAFRCMSFSFITDGPKPTHNCYLSDIMQRDLLPNVDYVQDPHSWLFTWDNFNPQCQIQEKESNYDFPLDIWKVYSVSGWPCRRGTKCRENREAGFWYCELEGGSNGAWDYCCSPDHHCGLSNGYPYSWCYVGPDKTQWRKCNEQYYPYLHDRVDSPPPHTPGYRPDRPNAHPTSPTTKPSLNEYEQQFDNEFLSPPKPGGFGQPRRWPVSYLHKEMPPNGTVSTKLAAIKSLIEVIKNTEVNDVQYRLNGTKDDVLYVKIPLPTFDDVNMTEATNEVEERAPKSLYRRGFVTRTNWTRNN